MLQWLLITAPIIAIASWWLGRRSVSTSTTDLSPVTRDYLQGINYLLNEQADKAVELFIKMITVDADTVETHLALGNLFRRRGEVDRAIRIHQNVIAMPKLAKPHRIEALLALGRDYMLAGVLDRAKKLMREVVESGEYVEESLNYLLDIYQQEKDWEQAIIIAERQESVTSKSMQKEIAHFYCELALETRVTVSSEQAMRHLKRALSLDNQCVRASLLMGGMEAQAGNYRSALRILQRISTQDPEFISEAIPNLLVAARALHQEEALMQFLLQCLEQHPHTSSALLLSEYIQQAHGLTKACEFIAEQLKRNATLPGLQRYLNLQIDLTQGNEKQSLQLLESLIAQMLVNKPVYQCVQCGFSGRVLHWQCPSCKLWGSTKPIAGGEHE